MPKDAPLEFNFREKVTPAEEFREESPAKGALGSEDGGVPESDFRYPQQNRFTGLIERIQNNPEYLAGYDLSDSFIASDSEEEEDSQDHTFHGGFFINKGAILKKPESEIVSPEKEKKRPRKGTDGTNS